MIHCNIGDKFLRVCPPDGGIPSQAIAIVKQITDNHVVCDVLVDYPRTMIFDRIEGRSIDHPEQFLLKVGKMNSTLELEAEIRQKRDLIDFRDVQLEKMTKERIAGDERNAALEAENAALRAQLAKAQVEANRYWQMQEEGLITIIQPLGRSGYYIETRNGITTRKTDEQRASRRAVVTKLTETRINDIYK